MRSFIPPAFRIATAASGCSPRCSANFLFSQNCSPIAPMRDQFSIPRSAKFCPTSKPKSSDAQLDFGQFSLLGNGRFAGISNAGGNFRTVPGASPDGLSTIRSAIALLCVALTGRPVTFAQGGQGRLLLGGGRFG